MTVGALEDTVIFWIVVQVFQELRLVDLGTVLKGMQNQMPDQQRSSPARQETEPSKISKGWYWFNVFILVLSEQL